MSSTIKDTLSVFFLGILSSIVNFIFTILIIRSFSKQDYAEISASLSLIITLTIPFTILFIIVFFYISYFLSKSQNEKAASLIASSIKNSIFFGIIVFILMALLSPWISSILGITHPILIIISALLFSLTILINSFYGILNSYQGFVKLGLIRIVEFSATLFIFMLLPKLLWSPILSRTIAVLIAIGLCFLAIKKSRKQKYEIGYVGLQSHILKSIPSAICLGLLIGSSPLIVKIFFDSLISAQFAAIMAIAGFPLIIGFSISTVIFPKVTNLHSNGEDSSNLLRDAFVFLTIPSVLGIIFLFIFSTKITSLLIPAYDIAIWLPIQALTSFILGLITILSMYWLAKKKGIVAFPLFIGILLQIVLITNLPKTMPSVITSFLASAIVTFTILLFLMRKEIILAIKRKNDYLNYSEVIFWHRL